MNSAFENDSDSSSAAAAAAAIGVVRNSLDVVLEEKDKDETNHDAAVDVTNAATDTESRQQWSNPIEFLLSCIAMSVGLGNVWR
jgi:hypothetical protein